VNFAEFGNPSAGVLANSDGLIFLLICTENFLDNAKSNGADQ
jgi:hypothetical protein